MKQAALTLMLVAPVVLAGCAGAQNCEITPGEYQCQFGGGGDIDRTDTWRNDATQAEVKVQMGGTGDLTVTIDDADGTQVFSETFTGSGGQQTTKTTSSGTPGEWTVHIDGSYRGGLQVTIDSV